MENPTSEALKEPTRPVRLGFQILLSLANAGTIITLIPVLVVLIPAQVIRIDPVHSASSLALVLTLGAAGALVGNPLAGALSDRTTSRLGRRRPWLLVGMFGSALGVVVLANSRSIPLLAVSWMMVQFFGNMLLSAYGAILPDRVPVKQRGTTQAIIGLAAPIAIILSDILFTQAKDLRVAYYPIVIVMVVLTVMFVLLYREPQLPMEHRLPFRPGSFLASFWINPRANPAFARVWLMWFFVWVGYNLGTSGFLFLYIQNVTRFEGLFPGHQVKEAVAIVQMLQIAIGVPLMMAAGVISDRTRRRRDFVLAGIVLISLGLGLLIGFSGWPVVLAASVIIGVGFWIFYSLGLALITQMLPSASNRGKIINPIIGAAIVNNLGASNPVGYKILFSIGAASALLGFLLTRFIRK
jgi:MFS family permease